MFVVKIALTMLNISVIEECDECQDYIKDYIKTIKASYLFNHGYQECRDVDAVKDLKLTYIQCTIDFANGLTSLTRWSDILQVLVLFKSDFLPLLSLKKSLIFKIYGLIRFALLPLLSDFSEQV